MPGRFGAGARARLGEPNISCSRALIAAAVNVIPATH